MMAYHPLLNALVAPAQQLGHQRPAGVGMPHQLPSQIRFGSVAPGLAQNSPFSGGRVAAPGSPLQPTPAPTFTPTAQHSGTAAPFMAPYLSTPGGGTATLPIPGAGSLTGGAAPPPPTAPVTPTTLTTALRPENPAPIPPGQPFMGTTIRPGSGYPQIPALPGTGQPRAENPTPITLSSILSALSQQGQRLNTSSGASTIRI